MKSNLVICPVCGRQISSNAPVCPGCGEPVTQSSTSTGRISLRDPVHLVGVVISIIILLAILAAFAFASLSCLSDARRSYIRARNQEKAAEARQSILQP